MNKYVIVEGKPYLFADGRAYSVRRNSEGLKVGKAVELPSIPTRTYSELSINAKFPDGFDTIGEEVTEDEEEAFEAVTETAIAGTVGVSANEDDIVIARDGKDLVIPDEAAIFEPGEMTVAELREYAKEQGIELNGARTKAEIVTAINEGLGD